MPNPRAVVLLSGGLDSYTAAAIVARQGFELHTLTVRYGQRHAREIEAARRVAAQLGARQHREVNVDLAAFGGSALTAPLPVPKDREVTPGAGHRIPDPEIPTTYVPARNTVFLSLALSWAEVLGASDIVIGANAIDYSGYPDCRPAFIDAFEKLASVATKAGVEGTRFKVHAPLLHMSKGEIVRAGLDLGLDYGLTQSCYDPTPEGVPCRRCDSCRLRAKGFEEAGVADPLLARTPDTGLRTLQIDK
jgi:7-cyano-7-deazaguanine synthase